MTRFGQNRLVKIIFSWMLLALIFSCKSERSTYSAFLTPEGGEKVNAGTMIRAKLEFAAPEGVDSVVYFIDSTRVTAAKDTAAVNVPTQDIALGSHVLLARIIKGADSEEVTTNIVVVASKPPVEYGFRIKNTYPHDPGSYVEGLEFHDGIFYESAGQYK
ncbi:MAG: glutaminyl-peptide cyclotransferase, partial [Chitinophagaceae bacterium]